MGLGCFANARPIAEITSKIKNKIKENCSVVYFHRRGKRIGKYAAIAIFNKHLRN